MARLRADFIHGTLSTTLFSGGTTLESDDLDELMVVESPDIAVIILDPEAENGNPEIVHVIAHEEDATSATVLRGRENTTARQHPSGTEWVHGPTALDWRLGNLTDVEGTFSAGQVPVWNGSAFVPASALDTYVHEQSVLASVWTVTHDLGKYPSVTTVNASDNEIKGNVVYVSEDELTIEFSVPIAGKAYLN